MAKIYHNTMLKISCSKDFSIVGYAKDQLLNITMANTISGTCHVVDRCK